MPINNDWTKEEKYRNKLNIKDDLQDFWNDEEGKEVTEEKRIKKNDIKIESYVNKNKEANFNLNYKENNNINTSKLISILVILIIGGYTLFEIISYVQTKKANEKIINEQIIEYNKQVLEKQKTLNTQYKQQTQTYNNSNNTNNYKYFKVEYQIIDENYDRNFIYNIRLITNNLSNIKSKSNDNNYDVEIVGNLSKYGDLFYRIDKRKASSEYDQEINNILSELKKIKFKLQEETVNFKIYVNNNSYDLN